MKWFYTVGAIAAVTVLFFLLRPEAVIQVSLHTVETGVVEQTVANTRAGTIKACRRSRLSMPVGGQVEKLLVAEGDRVQKGQLLITLWNADRQARLDQSQATHIATVKKQDQMCLKAEHDRRDVDRVRQLFVKKLTSEDHLDHVNTQAETSTVACEAAEAETRVAAANIRVQRASLEQTRLTAPFAGVIAKITGELGEYVTPSPPGVPTPPAVDLMDVSCLYVTAPIDEVDAAALKLGLDARITLDAYRGQVFAGRVRRIAPYVEDYEKQARTVEVEVTFNKPPLNLLLVGYSSDIEIVVNSHEDVVRIPTESVLEDNRVWGVIDGRLRKLPFEEGLRNWTFTEAVSGVGEGMLVVTSLDAQGLVEGAAVSAGSQ